MRDMTEQEGEAIEGMRNGDLTPLLGILSKEQADFHPLLQRYLAWMIVGEKNAIDFKLKAEKHSYIKNKDMGVIGSGRASSKAMHVAGVMARFGGFMPNCSASALDETVKQTGLKKSTVWKYWSEHKDNVKLNIIHGNFEIDAANRPKDWPERPAHLPPLPE